ncbi:putative FHY3/FAR1 family protein [Helianthus annuus]|uniref:FHY3/FAR1 family protein n=3 Tax=Helianthus annuus TaxID=4232 RepID=A0A9K3DIV3_HELAN|nr:putative FHY3/FAR1 family protein [Helianthus annuus]
MRQAASVVYMGSLHRLCVWHIMKKLPSKVTLKTTPKSEHQLVWNIYIKLETFERRWAKLLEKYGLENHDWLRDMFNIKEF